MLLLLVVSKLKSNKYLQVHLVINVVALSKGEVIIIFDMS